MRPMLQCIVALTTGMLCYAQPADKGLTFDAASLKLAGPLVPGSQTIWRGGPGTDDPGRFTMPRATLSQLIQQAYDVWSDQVTGPIGLAADAA